MLPESKGWNLALTVVYVPYLLDSGTLKPKLQTGFWGQIQAVQNHPGHFFYIPFGSQLPFKERCPPRQKSGVERLKAKVEPLLTQVTVDAGCKVASRMCTGLVR